MTQKYFVEEFNTLTALYLEGKSIKPSENKLMELLSIKNEFKERSESISINESIREKDNGLLVFDTVSFSYPDGKVILRDSSFVLNEGESFLLLGVSGSGKSTIANLIVGLYPVTSGSIFFLMEQDYLRLQKKVFAGKYILSIKKSFHGRERYPKIYYLVVEILYRMRQ